MPERLRPFVIQCWRTLLSLISECMYSPEGTYSQVVRTFEFLSTQWVKNQDEFYETMSCEVCVFAEIDATIVPLPKNRGAIAGSLQIAGSRILLTDNELEFYGKFEQNSIQPVR